MINPETDNHHTAHTTNPVPFVYIGNKNVSLQEPHLGTLTDIAPTVLAIMKIEQPKEMTGQSLIKE
jgi:2,3-bisphosphoglycerate-independent phosphoglycerate mutase